MKLVERLTGSDNRGRVRKRIHPSTSFACATALVIRAGAMWMGSGS